MVVQQSTPRWRGFVLVVGLLAARCVWVVAYNQHLVLSAKLGFHVRTMLITAIYRKSLVLSGRSRLRFSSGRIMNMMSTDVKQLDLLARELVYMLFVPGVIAASLGLLIGLYGVSALTVVAVLVSYALLQPVTARYTRQWRGQAVILTDERIHTLQETLAGIRVVKMFAWEDALLDKINQLRTAELRLVRLYLLLVVIVDAYSSVVGILAVITMFITHVATGGTLVAADVFSAVAIVASVIYMPIVRCPRIVSAAVSAWVSIKRINEFLCADELSSLPPIDPDASHAIHVAGGTFTWPSDGEAQGLKPFILRNVDLALPRGQLVGVCGAVGSGKSSLCEALLGEMQCIHGEVRFGGRLGYCPQKPWIMNATLRDNILFGLPFDEERYWEIIRCCALEADIDSFPGTPSPSLFLLAGWLG